MPTVTQEIVGKGNTKAIRMTKRNATYTYFLLEEVKKKKKKKAMGRVKEETQFKLGTEAAQRCLPGRGKGSCCGGRAGRE